MKKEKYPHKNSLILPWLDTALLLAKSTLLPTNITGRDLNKSASCNRVISASAFRKLALSTTEYKTTKASGGFVLSISCNHQEKKNNNRYTYTRRQSR